MGSAAGRRKCCASFYEHGYHTGYDNLTSLCNTVSKTFKGLYRIGFEQGQLDKSLDRPKRRYPYDNYCCARDCRDAVLDFMADGYVLAYEPSAHWPNHPFTLTSPDGTVILRRRREDLDNGPQDYALHRLPIVRALAEERAADVKASIAKGRAEGSLPKQI